MIVYSVTEYLFQAFMVVPIWPFHTQCILGFNFPVFLQFLVGSVFRVQFPCQHSRSRFFKVRKLPFFFFHWLLFYFVINVERSKDWKSYIVLFIPPKLIRFCDPLLKLSLKNIFSAQISLTFMVWIWANWVFVFILNVFYFLQYENKNPIGSNSNHKSKTNLCTKNIF